MMESFLSPRERLWEPTCASCSRWGNSMLNLNFLFLSLDLCQELRTTRRYLRV